MLLVLYRNLLRVLYESYRIENVSIHWMSVSLIPSLRADRLIIVESVIQRYSQSIY